MQAKQNVIDCYNKTASAYAGKFNNELGQKHLDKILLTAFAEENKGNGRMIDLGCGPGQTTKYLYEHGVKDIVGTDLSPAMISVAKELHPGLSFETADMLSFQYPADSFGSAIAFYSIVHFDYAEIEGAFGEIRRILKNGGQFLFSFHHGENIVHLENFLDQPVNIDFYFFDAGKIKNIFEEAGFEMIDCIQREPYNGIEYASRRGYFWIRNIK